METRPFNLEHAKAGAPVCVNGQLVTLLTTVRNDVRPIIVMDAQGDITTFTIDGKGRPKSGVVLEMAMINLLEGRPIFFDDVLEVRVMGTWEPWKVNKAIWLPEARYRWPKPKRNIPKTSMNDAELVEAFNMGAHTTEAGRRSIANTAIERAVGDGDLIPANEVDHMAAADAMRDEILTILDDAISHYTKTDERLVLNEMTRRIAQIDAGKFDKP